MLILGRQKVLVLVRHFDLLGRRSNHVLSLHEVVSQCGFLAALRIELADQCRAQTIELVWGGCVTAKGAENQTILLLAVSALESSGRRLEVVLVGRTGLATERLQLLVGVCGLGGRLGSWRQNLAVDTHLARIG